MDDKKSTPQIFSAIKTIIKTIFFILFGLIGCFIITTADGIADEIYEDNRRKIIKVVYIVICILLVAVILITGFLLFDNKWLIIPFSALGIPLILMISSWVFGICFYLFFWLFEKIRKTSSFAPIISFCVVMILVTCTVLSSSAYLINDARSEATPPQKNTNAYDNEGGFNYNTNTSNKHSGTDYDRLEPTYDTDYYIGNTKTRKYHLPSCAYLPSKENSIRIKKENIDNYYAYTPCGHCLS